MNDKGDDRDNQNQVHETSRDVQGHSGNHPDNQKNQKYDEEKEVSKDVHSALTFGRHVLSGKHYRLRPWAHHHTRLKG